MTAPAGPVLVFRDGMPAFVDPLSLPAPTPAGFAALVAGLASTNAAIVAIAQRLAALEGKPDPCVALTGTLPVATLQIGTAIVQVPVASLLSTDRVAVAPAGDPPAGLSIAWAHPSPTAAGVLVVGVSALASLAGKPALALLVTALR